MKTRAAVLYRLNEPLVIEEIEVPELRKGQVLVKVLYSGICGSQRNEIRGYKGTDKYLPHLMGHEASGIVQKIGSGVKKVKNGDYVVLSWIKGRGIDVPSSTYSKDQILLNAGAITTLGEYTVVSENRVFKISKNISPDVAALLGCAVPTGAGAVINTLKAQKGSSIAIFGVGGIGAAAIMAAKMTGCKFIIAIDITDQKLLFAKKIGATHTINASKGDTLSQIQNILPKGVDYALEAAGTKETMETAFAALQSHGILAIAGNVKDGIKIELTPFEFIKGKKVIGTWGGDTIPERDLLIYTKAFRSGILPLEKLITHCFSFYKINEAFSELATGKAGRILIKF